MMSRLSPIEHDLGGVLHRVRERLEVAVEPDRVALRGPDGLLLEDLGVELVELLVDPVDALLRLLTLADEEAEP